MFFRYQSDNFAISLCFRSAGCTLFLAYVWTDLGKIAERYDCEHSSCRGRAFRRGHRAHPSRERPCGHHC